MLKAFTPHCKGTFNTFNAFNYIDFDFPISRDRDGFEVRQPLAPTIGMQALVVKVSKKLFEDTFIAPNAGLSAAGCCAGQGV